MHTGKAFEAVVQGAQRSEARAHGAAMYVAAGEMREGVALGVRERSRMEPDGVRSVRRERSTHGSILILRMLHVRARSRRARSMSAARARARRSRRKSIALFTIVIGSKRSNGRSRSPAFAGP